MPTAAEAKLLVRQARHLREIAHGGFRRIRLPVCICREGGRGIPGQIRSDVGEILRIQGQPVLEPLDQVKQDHGDGAEEQHGDAVLAPVHFLAFIHAGYAIDDLLDGT
jgi:hypothetical protein